MNTAVLTVVFESARPYMSDFLTSIQQQTTDEFELVVVNDGMKNIEELLSGLKVKTRVLYFQGSFVSLRKQAILWLANAEFEKVIFADSDDYFESLRVQLTQSLLDKYDMVCNEIVLFGAHIQEPVPMISPRFFDEQLIRAEHIMNGNIMGMSNTGVRLHSILSVIESIPDDIVAMDWLLYTKALLLGNSCIFTNKIKTLYRQHSQNIASPLDWSDAQIGRGVEVKYNHYRNLQDDGAIYRMKTADYQKLIERMTRCEVFRNDYFDIIRRNRPDCPLWWEAIKTDKELPL